MSQTITVRITTDLALWLKETARRGGVSQGRIVREQLEALQSGRRGRPFLSLAGAVHGPADLSRRKGFSSS